MEKPFHVEIKELVTGRYRINFYYFTDCRDTIDCDCIPIDKVIAWLFYNKEIK